MKAILLVCIVVFADFLCFGQGSIQFNNRVTGTSTSAVVAPIYGPDPTQPYVSKHGQAATGPTTPIPTGTQSYGGVPLVGTGFTASIWARPAGSSAPFVQAATTPFRATTSTSLFGFWTVPGTAVVLPNVASDPNVHAEIIIRVWDNKGGTITSWDQLYDSATGLANPANGNVARGEGPSFVVTDQLGGGVVLPPTLRGMESFELWAVPEPSVLALLGISLGYFVWRRKAQ